LPLLVGPALGGGDGKVRDGPAARSEAHFRVASQIADDDGFVHHGTPSLSFRLSLAAWRSDDLARITECADASNAAHGASRRLAWLRRIALTCRSRRRYHSQRWVEDDAGSPFGARL